MRISRGMLAAASAYVLWGFLPIYWKFLQHVSAQEILIHRILWSLVTVVLLLTVQRQWQWLRVSRERPAILRTFVVTGVLLAINWLVYIWANNHGHIVEASLGYFITPLVNVVLGLVFLHERMRPAQWLAIGIAAAGVLYLILNAGGLLWISFTLAFSFGIYGLLRKTAQLGSLPGLTVEMAVLCLPALAYALFLQSSGQAAFAHGSPTTTILLAFSGVITAVPLLLFAFGARQVPLTSLGVLQYIAPTMQFLIGVLLYGERFTPSRIIGFSLIWLALILYGWDSYRQARG